MKAVLHRYGQRHSARRAAATLAGLLGAAVIYAPALAEPAVHIVVIEGMKFVPEVLQVNPGDTVEWHNKDIVPHNATAENRAFRSPTISPTGKWTYKARNKGEYTYLCTLHPVMKAKLIIR